MTAALLLVVGLAFVAGLVAVMIRLDRAHRRIVERRREAWKAEGASVPSQATSSAPVLTRIDAVPRR